MSTLITPVHAAAVAETPLPRPGGRPTTFGAENGLLTATASGG